MPTLQTLTFHYLLTPDNDRTILLPDPPVPVEALTRIEILLGVHSEMEFLTVFISRVYACLAEAEVEHQDAAAHPLLELCHRLYKLRQEVLKRIPREVRHKNQQLDLTQIGDSISLLILEFTAETDRLIYKDESLSNFLASRPPGDG